MFYTDRKGPARAEEKDLMHKASQGHWTDGSLGQVDFARAAPPANATTSKQQAFL